MAAFLDLRHAHCDFEVSLIPNIEPPAVIIKLPAYFFEAPGLHFLRQEDAKGFRITVPFGRDGDVIHGNVAEFDYDLRTRHFLLALREFEIVKPTPKEPMKKKPRRLFTTLAEE